MPDRERFQALMLEHVYGLLDDKDRLELEAYLATPEGAELARESEKWQARLAGAAKDAHPQVTFQVPASPAVPPIRHAVPATTATPRPTMAGVWQRWALAASVLVVACLGVPAATQFTGWYFQKQEVLQAQQKVGEADRLLAEARQESKSRTEAVEKAAKEAETAQAELVKNYQDAIFSARKSIEQKDFMVQLSGPARIQPGAPNEWRIQTLNKQGGYTLPKKLEVVMRDQNNRELLRETHDKPQAPSTLKLPTSFWEGVKPGSELFLEVVAYNEDNHKSVLAEKVPLARSVFVTHLATDKPLYKKGEVVHFRSLTLDRATFLPPDHDTFLKFRLRDPASAVVELDNGNGRVMDGLKPLLGPDRKPVRGIGIGDYEIPDETAGGEYALEVWEINEQTRAESLLATRKFIVNSYVTDVFEKKLEFDGKSYGANDWVQARLEASRTAGGALVDGRANIVASVEGVPFYNEGNVRFNSKGVLNIRFKLPGNVGNGNASLAVTVIDGGQPETIVRPIPVIGKNLNVEFFPEGGDLVEGVSSRVYVQVRTPQGKPADLKGQITDGKDKVADVATLTDAEHPGVNRGQGVFVFTPLAGKKYFLKVETPGTIEPPAKEGFPLPAAKADGVILTAADAVTERGDPIRLKLQVGQGTKTLQVGAYARGRLIEHKRIEVVAGKPADVQLQGDEKLGGVTRITVFEEPAKAGEGRANLIPRAERLVYRKPAEQLHIGVNPDKTRYSPAGKVSLELSSVNEKEVAAPAVLMVAVVNQSVITMADNKTDRLMPTQFLIAGDVKNPGELEHADFLLTEHPKAAVALDLLLGTQGWRRFAEQNIPAAKPEDRSEVERMLVSNGQRTQAPVDLYHMEERRVNSEFQPKLEEVALRANEADEKQAEFFGNEAPALAAKVQSAETTRTLREDERSRASAELFEFETRFGQVRSMAMPVFLIAVMCLAIGAVILSIRQQAGRRAMFHATAVASLAIAVVLMAGIYVTSGDYQSGRDYSMARMKNANGTKVASRDIAPGKAQMPDMRDDAVGLENAKEEAAPKAAAQFDGAGGIGGGGAIPAPAPTPPGMMAPRMAPAMRADKAKLMDEARKFEKQDGKPGAFNDAKGAVPRLAADRQLKMANNLNRELKEEQAKRVMANGAGKMMKDARAAMAPGRGFRPMGGPAVDEQFGGMPGGPGGFGGGRRFPGGGPGMPGGFPGGGFPGGGFGGGRADMMLKGDMDQLAPIQALPFVYREYAHARDPELSADVRSDFAETVYWHPVIVLPDNAKTNVNFQLSDAIATYQVMVAGHTVDGRIGAVTKTIEARKPFTVDPKLPLEVTSSDVIDVPVRVVNDSDTNRSVSFTLHPTGLKVEGGSLTTAEGLVKDTILLSANEKGRKVFRVRPTTAGEAVLIVNGNSEPTAEPDMVGRVMKVVPEGFPGVGATSDMLETKATGYVSLPKDMVKNTLKVKLDVYPTTMSDLVKGLDGLLREPGGCFEQTSTSNYPNTLILEYMQNANQTNPEVSKRAKDLLDRGYAILKSYECPDTPAKMRQGFEWFGSTDMAHEALTAYGLLQFKDMAKVFPVDPVMIKRTQDFLLSRRDGQGGFKRNAQALDSFGGAPKHTTDAYITWALVESDPDNKEGLDLKKEIAALKAQALKKDSKEERDSYFVALVANILLLRDDRETAVKLMTELQQRVTKEGFVQGAETSITFSHGRDLDIETTAMGMLGWVRVKELSFAPTIKQTTKWISQQRGGYGGFGSTQSTIMALKALITQAKANAHPPEAGEVTLSIGGRRVGTKKFTEKDVETISLDLETPETLFKAGEKTEVLIETSAKQPYPFTLGYTYTSLTPVSGEKCEVRLTTKLAKDVANEGDSVPLNVSFENLKNQGQGMTVAIIGLPAGMKVPTDMKQLTDLREKKTISYFELRGRELILYWRNMAPNQKIDLTVDLVCDMPGEYRGPASRGYLYYTADHKNWIEPLAIKINPLAPKDEKVAAK
ncbi:alpha-2-macroglobulin family protein [Zavarzinella formosa]|uniref:alpha-2-macroglobulin family protein n=1 Tax=Zavarzinella formosa TaxID=360055 RepID=UPI00038038CF|nr:alpha-2-macroglobulin family protein [Zavarzinella formosa]